MALNYAVLAYLPVYDFLARPITVTPFASQPSAGAYINRGIYNTDEIDILAEDGSLISNQKTELYVLEMEFAVVPQQGDRIHIGAVDDIPALPDDFEVIDASSNSVETTLKLRKLVQDKPA